MTDDPVNIREKQFPECGWLQHFPELTPASPHGWTLSSPGAQADLDRQPDGSCQLSLKWILGSAANWHAVIARAKALSTTAGSEIIRSIAGFSGDGMDEMRCMALQEAGFRQVGGVQLTSRGSTPTASHNRPPEDTRVMLTCTLNGEGHVRWADELDHPEIADFLTDVFRDSTDVTVPVSTPQPSALGSQMIIHAALLSRICYVRMIIDNRHGRITGAAILQSDGWLSCLGVAAGQRRRGIATRLLDGQWNDELSRITCTVDQQNQHAIEFYRAAGFQFRDSAPLFAWQKAAAD